MSRWTFLRPKESGFAIEPRLKKARAFPGLNEAVMLKTDFDLVSRARSGNTGMSWSPAPERSSGRQPTVNRSGATASGSVKSPADVRARSPPPNDQQPVDKPCRGRASRTGPGRFMPGAVEPPLWVNLIVPSGSRTADRILASFELPTPIT